MIRLVRFWAAAAALFFAAAPIAAEDIACKVTPSFSSGGSIGDAVAGEIRATEKKILLALFGFNNPRLADELAQLAKRGVAVRVKIDAAKGGQKKETSVVEMLKSAGAEVQAVAPQGRNHNKFAVIDGEKILTGSYNWTIKAESNWENLLVIRCAELARMYESEWEKIR
jgi:phosphatidylserine/phosphatidylglycerophosphate/cardiolipin synthase-like enzyme